MDRKSRRARKLAASGVTVLGLAAALAVTAPTAANAQRADHNCGNFQYNGQTFGAPSDGHHRHRGAFHTAAHHGVGRLDPVDDHDSDDPADHGRGQDADHGDHDGDNRGANAADHRDNRDGDSRGDHDGDSRGDHDADHDGDHRDGDRDGDHRDGDRDGDHRGDRDGDHRGDRDHRGDTDGDHRYASDARGDDYVNDGEGNYNCGNFGYHGKQMYVPQGLFDGGDHH